MFEMIKNDPYILETYEKIENPQYNDKFWSYHGLTHVNSVIDRVEKIMIQLGYDSEYIESAKIAALMHDLGMIKGKEEHNVRSYEMAKQFLIDRNINLKYKDEILEAIKLHRGNEETNNVMAVVLIFADKLDIKKSILAPDGYKILGIRQYQYIEDINMTIQNDNLLVQFVIDEGCNKEELEEWYFIAKVFNAIDAFASHFGFNSKVLWNDNEWTFKKKVRA